MLTGRLILFTGWGIFLAASDETMVLNPPMYGGFITMVIGIIIIAIYRIKNGKES